MLILEPHPRPESWQAHRSRLRPGAVWLFFALEWCLDWVAWALSNWKFVEVLQRLGSFSVLAAVIFYFAESGKRTRGEHYQAWQVINTAQGKGGSGGRIEALQELNNDRIPLIGVDASGAFLQGIRLDGARMLRSNLESVDLRQSSLRGVDLQNSNLRWTNFRYANLEGASFRFSSLNNADLSHADLKNADLTGVDLSDADLRYANVAGVRSDQIASAKLANIYGLRNRPASLIQRLIAAGAVAIQSDKEWSKLEESMR